MKAVLSYVKKKYFKSIGKQECLVYLAEVVVKRKRGRPKGSTKKVQPEKVQKNTPNQQENESTETQPLAVAEEPSEDGSDLECKKCNRVFSNRRQISKHICFVGLKEAADDEEYNGTNLCQLML